MKRDDPATTVLLVYRSRDINIAILPNGHVSYRTQTFSHDAGVKTRWQDQPIWLIRNGEPESHNEDKNSGKRSHTLSLNDHHPTTRIRILCPILQVPIHSSRPELLISIPAMKRRAR